MNKKKISFDDLIKKNKEELLKDKVMLEKIEQKIEAKHVGQK
ncbi:FbpB family small basic protein [Aquibacillus koreensis]|uniref:FbpB family small basic protein n=1 Tax=Aquibacillus koreensis TaxID=279446 RepID=A0A9X3WM47_9BACI|nr:FbpB family small basic protein [Aquibacillus koreensis]MCT2534200.1 FbpB family small basic protein [Aquibacillus koreensis]MDC3422592.1 FbpB family small basic protein [Aquibacillus koreensis]